MSSSNVYGPACNRVECLLYVLQSGRIRLGCCMTVCLVY